MKVVKAYRTNHFPAEGNISEEILVLEDGRAVYLNPGEPDEVYDSFEAASEAAFGEAEESESLLAAWSGGYTIEE